MVVLEVTQAKVIAIRQTKPEMIGPHPDSRVEVLAYKRSRTQSPLELPQGEVHASSIFLQFKVVEGGVVLAVLKGRVANEPFKVRVEVSLVNL